MKTIILVFVVVAATVAYGQQPDGIGDSAGVTVMPPRAPENKDIDTSAKGFTDTAYVLGPGDEVQVYIAEAEESADKATLVDANGYIRVPLIGRVRVGGMTVSGAEALLVEKLKTYFIKPHVVLTISQYGSQPVSVIGAVKQPGVQQVRGKKNLVEVLSMAGGLDPNAGTSMRVTRRIEYGTIPLPGAITDPSGQFSVAEVNLKSLLQSKRPEDNIQVLPHDVLSIPVSGAVYVIGEVLRSGVYAYGDRNQVTVLQAVSMAGGLSRNAKPKDSRLLRLGPDGTSRTEVAVNLKGILDGNVPDIPMQAEDILYVPDNLPKRAVSRALETALTLGTGVLIWR